MRVVTGLVAALGMLGLTMGIASAQGTWSSVALDMTGGYTVITGADSEDAAKQQAMDRCEGDDCYAVFATESQCFSIADTPEGNYQYGWSYGSTEEGVRLIALGYCIESGFGGCKTLISQCVTPGQNMSEPPGPGPKTKTKG